MQKDENIAADFPDETPFPQFSPSYAGENFPKYSLSSFGGSTSTYRHTLEKQSLCRFAFQIRLLTFPSLLPSISCSSLPPPRGGTGVSQFFIPFTIAGRPGAALKKNNEKKIKKGEKRTGEGSRGKREKEKNACQLQTAAAPARTQVAFCSVHINASYPAKLFPLE